MVTESRNTGSYACAHVAHTDSAAKLIIRELHFIWSEDSAQVRSRHPRQPKLGESYLPWESNQFLHKLPSTLRHQLNQAPSHGRRPITRTTVRVRAQDEHVARTFVVQTHESPVV